MGYGKANNYAVKQAQNNILYFINTDVFAEKECFSKMLDALMLENVACVQPLLIGLKITEYSVQEVLLVLFTRSIFLQVAC